MNAYKRLFITWWISLLISSYNLYSQNSNSVDKWMEYIEDMAENSEDEAKIGTLYAELSYLVEHPFELNSVTEQDLQRLPFLTDAQIRSLVAYPKRYGKMVSVYELKGVEGLDYATIQLLLPFVYVGEAIVDKPAFTVKNLLKLGSNEVQIRYDQCFQQKKGYGSYPDSTLQKYPNRKYLGEPFYHSLRYSYSFFDRLQVGVVAEKDAGEPFWTNRYKGYDFYSFHLLLKDIKWLKCLALGDYKASFGQGLVMSNDFHLSRTAMVTQAERRTNGFRRHYSTNEADFFRGAAATISLKKIDISLFYSTRKVDADLKDSTFSSIKTDGYHRLERDWEKRHTLSMQTVGGNVRYATPQFAVGMTALSYSFGQNQLVPEPKPYNLFYFSGKSNINIGVDYLLKLKNIKFYGETALSENRAVATLNALELTPASYISLLMLYRYYDKRYQAYYGSSFSQGSGVQNEQGLYMGLQLTPVAYWRLSAYVDIFRFPWLKYGIDAPSSGSEYMAQVDYTSRSSFSTLLRYTYRQKEKNKNEGSAAPLIEPYRQHRLKIQANYGLSALLFRTSVDGVLYDEGNGMSKGVMISQSAGWTPPSLPIRADLYAAYFTTDDYTTRISSYEKNILYAFNYSSFYGKGIRLATVLRCDLFDALSLSVKLAYTHYLDRDKIGTDTEEIAGADKTDIYALLRWKF